MNILVLSLFFPYPEVTHSGGTDLFHYIEALYRRGHSIILVSFIDQNEIRHLESMKPYCLEILTIPAKSNLLERIRKAIYLLGFPRQWVEARSWMMRMEIRRVISEIKIDTILVEHLWMAQYYDVFNGIPYSLDEVDVDSIVISRRAQQVRNVFLRKYRNWCAQRTQELEEKYGRRAKNIFVRSEANRHYLSEIIPESRVDVLPPWYEGLNINEVPPPLANRKPFSLLFAGNMKRELNVEAVVFFCRSVFPTIIKRYPQAILYIVGDAPTPTVLGLANENVVVTGYVESWLDYYLNCQIFIAPLFTGGGIIVKMLDALSSGCLVVASAVANEGICSVNGRDFLQAESSQQYVDLITWSFDHLHLAQEIANHGVKFAESLQSWEGSMDDLEKILTRTE